jgi:EAL and modified HD-GYP domain-containing signal transduction protein
MPASSADTLHLLSRNPVFSAAKSVWGYEIQSMSGPAEHSRPESAGQDVGAVVIAGDCVGLKTIVARNKKMLLAYTREQLESMVPRAVPAHASAVLVDARCQGEASVPSALAALAAEGHTVALEWDPRLTPSFPALDVASVICLAGPDGAADPSLQAVLASGAGDGHLALLVRNVDTRRDLENLQALGATLFQGRFFKTAEIIPGRRLSSHQNSRLQILGAIGGEDPDPEALARIVQSDVSLSYRLLAYLNSPAFGFMRRIDSIRQAITLLGWKNVRNWLRAVLLADIAQGEVQGELLHLSLRRGRFLEQLVTRHDYWDFGVDEMFLLGMFSLLDAILGVSMHDALACLPLNEVQKKALTASGPTEYAPLLALMTAFEDGDQHVPDRMLHDLSLNPAEVRLLHREAGAWAAAVLEVGSQA